MDATLDVLNGTLGPLQNRLEQLQAERQDLIDQAGRVGQEIHRIERVLRAAFPERFAPATNPKRHNKPTSTASISDERLAPIQEKALELLRDRDHITQSEVRLALGKRGESINATLMSQAFKKMRDRQVLRAAGHLNGIKIYKLVGDREPVAS